IRFWQVDSWQELPPPPHPLGPWIWACAFSRDGRFFAASGNRGVILWKIGASPADRRPEFGLLLHQVARLSQLDAWDISFSPDGTLVAWSGSPGPRLHLWDVANSRAYLFPPLRVNSMARCLAFYRDGKHLAFIRKGGMPEVWNVVTKERVAPSGRGEFQGARER